ncbi:hypothetical protein ACFWPU_28220 [Streptomyces sp. NPDC058471]|uniref:hypothetical protein n=1 Tax=Streptomyces sp. NPDC058471 TaxID=3346516 RepID=UPI00365B4ED6
MSKTSCGPWPAYEREARIVSGSTGARLAKWSRVAWIPSERFTAAKMSKVRTMAKVTQVPMLSNTRRSRGRSADFERGYAVTAGAVFFRAR